MATKICRHCRTEIDEKASVCPACGTSLSDWPGIIAIVLVFGPIFLCMLVLLLGNI